MYWIFLHTYTLIVETSDNCNLLILSHINLLFSFAALKKHDVAFLITLRPVNTIGTGFRWSEPFVPQVGLTYVRGCEVEGMLDEKGHVIEEGPEPRPRMRGSTRTYRVWLDPNQYQKDMSKTIHGNEVCCVYLTS